MQPKFRELPTDELSSWPSQLKKSPVVDDTYLTQNMSHDFQDMASIMDTRYVEKGCPIPGWVSEWVSELTASIPDENITPIFSGTVCWLPYDLRLYISRVTSMCTAVFSDHSFLIHWFCVRHLGKQVYWYLLPVYRAHQNLLDRQTFSTKNLMVSLLALQLCNYRVFVH